MIEGRIGKKKSPISFGKLLRNLVTTMRQVLPTNLKKASGGNSWWKDERWGRLWGRATENVGMSTLMCTGAAFIQSLTR